MAMNSCSVGAQIRLQLIVLLRSRLKKIELYPTLGVGEDGTNSQMREGRVQVDPSLRFQTNSQVSSVKELLVLRLKKSGIIEPTCPAIPQISLPKREGRAQRVLFLGHIGQPHHSTLCETREVYYFCMKSPTGLLAISLGPAEGKEQSLLEVLRTPFTTMDHSSFLSYRNFHIQEIT